MRYFANPSTSKVRDAMRAGLLDCIVTPKQGNKIPEGVPYCADNGKFGEGYPGDDAWWAWLQRLPREHCVFAVAPDVPFDALPSLDLSLPWLPKIRSLGLRAALVAQNGFEHIPAVSWDEFDVLFLGGTKECLPCGYRRPVLDLETKYCPHCNQKLPEWKCGSAARQLTAEAKARGLQVHMGRVNSERRFRTAYFFGCYSADGTYIKRAPDKNLPKVFAWFRGVLDQGDLFGGAA